MDSTGCGPLCAGIMCAGFTAGLVWIDRTGGTKTWAQISSGIARRTWGIGDWIGQSLVFLILILLTILFALGSVIGVAVWIWSLLGKLSEEDRTWRLKASGVERSAAARPGRIKVTKLQSGTATRHSSATFSFYFEVEELGDGPLPQGLNSLIVEQAASFGTIRRSWRPTEFNKSESLLDQLIRRNLETSRVKEPGSKQGRQYTTISLPAAIKVDNPAAPEIVIAEADGTRIWCSRAGTYPGRVYISGAKTRS